MSSIASEAAGSVPPQRFFFVHLQKTAGTSLLIRMGNQFRPEQIYPDETDGDLFGVMPQLEPSQLVKRWEARKEEIRVVSGHFPLCTVELLDAPFTTFTVLREPVERTLSYLRHHRKMTPADRDTPLEEIYEDPLRFRGLIHNHMVKMFGLELPEMTGGSMTPVDFTPEHLERALARLETVDVIGLQEDFDAFCATLERRFSWDLGPPLVANDTPSVPVDPAFRARIAADNALDVELYEAARSLVARRAAAG
ncbi:MAG: hypothetical protein ACXWCB_06970 [Acidimicrobiales bacterium]